MRLLIVLIFLSSCKSELDYYPALDFDVVGQHPLATGYRRLPDDAEGKVRPEVWLLSGKPSGLAVRFRSNSERLGIRWVLDGEKVYSNISRICSSGVDLYCYRGGWQYIGSGELGDEEIHEKVFDVAGEFREYMVYLPLSNVVESLEIGVLPGKVVERSDSLLFEGAPVVVYGTSITQGASASRPGLSYTSRLQRRTGFDFINLGFSGNGFFEKELAPYIISAGPRMVILDCTTNSLPDTIRRNVPVLVRELRKSTDVPILLLESTEPVYMRGGAVMAQNAALYEVYGGMVEKNVFYVRADSLISRDLEYTVDGRHLNDVGFESIQSCLYPMIK
jgi:hypothetical protein